MIRRSVPEESADDDRLPHRDGRRALAGRGRGGGPRPAPARSDLPPPVPPGLHVSRRNRPHSLPARPGNHAPVRLAVPAGAPRQHARLRHHQPPAAQPRGRHGRGPRRPGRGPARTRHGPGPRHRAQPHGHRQRQPLVVRRAGERPRVALRRLLRHRLAVVAAAGAAQPPARAGPRRAVRQGAGGAAAPPGVRGRRFYDPVFRPSLSRRALHLRHGPRPTPRRAEGRPRRGRPAGPGIPQHPQRRQPPARPHGNRPGETGGAAAREGGRQAAARGPRRRERQGPRIHRAERGPVQRQAGRRGQLRPAGQAARRPGLPPVVLARGVRRDQLPPLFRHQRTGGAEHGAAGGLRGHARPHFPPAPRGQDRRPAHRPPRRAVRPQAVPGTAAAPLRPGAREADLRAPPHPRPLSPEG